MNKRQTPYNKMPPLKNGKFLLRPASSPNEAGRFYGQVSKEPEK